MPQAAMPMPAQTPNMMMGGPGQTQMPMQQSYAQRGFYVLPAVTKSNPNYKTQVGEFIFEHVEKIAGEEQAPKITGMLIDLPIEDIKGYLQDYSKLEEKVREAETLLKTTA